MSTYNVDNRTGGLDGSLAYELDREEACLKKSFVLHLYLLNVLQHLELWLRIPADSG